VKPIILVSNDDGIRAEGVSVLAERLSDLAEIVVAAPDRERSATSHALTLARPLRADEVKPGYFAIDGTPADCVYLGVLHLCPRKPALVVSGINHGLNLGSDFFYSGTVAGAVEAAIRGVPSFAISLERGPREGFVAAAHFAHALARAILEHGLPSNTLLNVNVPNHGSPRGYRWTRLGQRLYQDRVDVRTDLRGRRYFWIGGSELEVEDDAESDATAVRQSVVSVTPLDLDLTSHVLLSTLPGWRLPGLEAILATEAAAPPRQGGDAP
jgi:5'-nucleotidase